MIVFLAAPASGKNEMAKTGFDQIASDTPAAATPVGAECAVGAGLTDLTMVMAAASAGRADAAAIVADLVPVDFNLKYIFRTLYVKQDRSLVPKANDQWANTASGKYLPTEDGAGNPCADNALKKPGSVANDSGVAMPLKYPNYGPSAAQKNGSDEPVTGICAITSA